ncbi:hypothetical protein XENTR_v10004490 [Xenopus tropicalis]|uniref:CMT1A duplicated region transcript 1 n=1 Tax=Xenopus tropicalis TaxID=8364 RepID=A0A6I8SWC6_XENTR|nr:CMT1A duplicated region transcript 1 protein [Xenopus tropicalis]KAE8577225.1 hypothetical protein XENTR_v10004490 [Xenopus tropicalis]
MKQHRIMGMMEVCEYRLLSSPVLRCAKVPMCQRCETCLLSRRHAQTKEWLGRASDASHRRFLFGVIRRLQSLELLQYLEKVLRPTLGKDFTYSRSRINPSLRQDLGTSGSDRALNRRLLLQFMLETWEWLKHAPYWSKANYTLLLLQMCPPNLVHSAANLIHVLIMQEMHPHTRKAVTPMGHSRATGQDGTQGPDQAVSSDDPSIMMVPTSFKSTSGVSLYKDFICCLPVHLSKRILGFLNKKSLFSCLFVSQYWYYLIKETLQDLDAERLVRNEAMILQGTSYKGVSISYAKIRSVPVPKVGEGGNTINAVERKFYQETKTGESLEAAYIDTETTSVPLEERNLFCGSYNVLILTGQGDHHRVIHFDGGRLVAVGSVDRKVKLFDLVEMKQVPPLIHGHAGSIRRVFLCEERGFLFSGGFDLSIRQWAVESGVCMRIFHGHMKTITSLDVEEDLLVSGAKDCHVKVWNIPTGKCLRTFKHKDPVLCVRIKERYVVSGCEKGLVKLWHMDSATLIKTLTGHSGPIKCLSFDQWHLISGSADGYAIAWSMMGNFQKRLCTFRHPKEVLCMEFLYLRVITGCADGKIRVFNFLNGDCLRVMRANSRADPVMSLCIRDNRMVINTPASIMIFQFEEVSWDYSQASERVDVLKERDKFKSAPLRVRPYSYVRAQRMKRVGSSNVKMYQQQEEEVNREGTSRLSHHARSLSAKSMKRAQDLHQESLKPVTWPELRNFRRSFAYIDLQPEFYKKSPSASWPRTAPRGSPEPISRESTATELKARDDSDAESGYGSPGRKSALSVSESATLERIRKRGPHSAMNPDQILLKVGAMNYTQRSDQLAWNGEYNAMVRDAWGPQMSPQEPQKRFSDSQLKERRKDNAVTRLERIESSAEIKTTVTPFELRKLSLKLKESLHGSETPSSIPPPVLLRAQTSLNRKKRVALPRRTASAVESGVKQIGKYTSCESIQPVKMVMGQRERPPQRKRAPERAVTVNPYREKSGFQLLTVQQMKEYEAEKVAQYQTAEAHVQANRDQESRKAWLRKIKGKNIDHFTKEGKIAAPELGPNVFL